jgi:hypothetical protein
MAKKRMSKELREAAEACNRLNGKDAFALLDMLSNVGFYHGDFVALLEGRGYAVPRALAKARRSDG